jgi:hypothetical protein
MRKLDHEWRSNFSWRSFLPTPKYFIEPQEVHFQKNIHANAHKRSTPSKNRELLSMLRFLEEEKTPKY